MARQQPYMVKEVESVSSLTLTPPAGKSILVKDINVVTTQASDFATIKTGQATVGYFQVAPVKRNHLTLTRPGKQNLSILQFLAKRGINTTYPVPEGLTFQVSLANNAALIRVVYEEWDAADIKESMPNGPGAGELVFVNYGTNKNEITASDWSTLDTNRNPAEFPDFPFGATVPSNAVMEILGIGCVDIHRNTYTGAANNYSKTERIRLYKGRECLFDRDFNGFFTQGAGAAAGSANYSYFGGTNEMPYYSQDDLGDLFMFQDPLVFVGGEELRIQQKCTIDANSKFAVSDLDVFTVLRWKPGK